MKILQIHSSDHMGGGGGTIAMERLHHGLLERGHDSRIICGRKTTASAYSRPVPRGRMVGYAEKLLGKLGHEMGLNDVHYLSSFRLRSTDFFREADLIHIHGTHGFFNYLALPGLTREKPAVFTLHDMWPMTGHCAFSMNCDRWATGCGECPHPDIHPAIKRDNTRLEWRLKQKVYDKSRISFVAVSRWLAEMGERGLLRSQPVHYIPNGIDTAIYEPIDPIKSREVLGISDARYVLIFVALSLSDKRKGGDVMASALKSLPESMKRETCLVVLGEGGKVISEQVGIRTLDLGYIRNDRLKAIAYSAADLCLFPTRADNLPLVLLESLACGTPMISSKVGGVPELVRDGVTGRLADPEQDGQFATLLQELLEDAVSRERMSKACRDIALAEYDFGAHLDRHLELYGSLLGANSSAKMTSTKLNLDV